MPMPWGRQNIGGKRKFKVKQRRAQVALRHHRHGGVMIDVINSHQVVRIPPWQRPPCFSEKQPLGLCHSSVKPFGPHHLFTLPAAPGGLGYLLGSIEVVLR